MKLLKILAAIPVVALMVVVAKVAQYAAVDVFGAQLGFDLASLLGVGPVIAFYIWLSIKFPKLQIYGFSRG